MQWFYDKEIFIYKYGENDDENGVAREGYTKVITPEPIMTDIQPYSSEKAKKDYGYDIETTDIMFCDVIPEIQEDAIIKYNNKKYSVQKILTWNDYLDVLLLETEVNLNE